MLVNKKSDATTFRGPLQAVILDWAGTTLDFGSCAPVAAIIAAFESQSVPITREQARAPMGKAKRDHIRTILEMPEVSKRWSSQHHNDLESAIDTIYAEFLPIQERLLEHHAQLIPGCKESIEHCRQRGMKIGSSTGYTRELMDILVPLAQAQGYQPDAILCASDVTQGRPWPWMCFENARRLDVYPPRAIVKVDDTLVGIEAGINAGMWTIGLAASGNLIGLDHDSYLALESADRDQRTAKARQQLLAHGAHVVIDSIAELPTALEHIDRLVAS